MLETIVAILSNDQVVTLLAAGFAALWSWFKATEWYQTRKNALIQKCETYLEAAAQETWDEVVRSWKLELGPGGKLSDAQRKEAMARSLRRGQEMLMKEGVDLFKHISPELCVLALENIVRRKNPKNVRVPVAVSAMFPAENP